MDCSPSDEPKTVTTSSNSSSNEEFENDSNFQQCTREKSQNTKHYAKKSLKVNSDIGDTEFICALCKKKLSTKFNFMVHKRKFKHTCNYCEQEFCILSDLIKHKNEVHES